MPKLYVFEEDFSNRLYFKEDNIILAILLFLILSNPLYAGESSSQPPDELPDYPSLPNFGEVGAAIAIQQAQAYKPEPRTNGEVIKNGKDYVVVDNKKQPACIFYLNYSSTTGQVTQYADVDYVNLRCDR